MPKPTRFYSKKLTATTTGQEFSFEDNDIRLSELSVLNVGPQNLFVEPDNGINENSPIVPVGAQIKLGPDALDLNYRAESQTAVFYIIGLRHSKA